MPGKQNLKEKTTIMKQKNAVIGALVISLLFSLAMGAVGLNAISNLNGTIASNGTTGSNTVQIILATPASEQSYITIPPTVSARSSGG
jgi:hypothetical protein